MKYTIRAYHSRQEAESGRVRELEKCETGSWHTAQHLAVQMSREDGYAILVNDKSGARHCYEKGVLVLST
jgi:hypothetical protein